jgi:hypothetical protein
LTFKAVSSTLLSCFHPEMALFRSFRPSPKADESSGFLISGFQAGRATL